MERDQELINRGNLDVARTTGNLRNQGNFANTLLTGINSVATQQVIGNFKNQRSTDQNSTNLQISRGQNSTQLLNNRYTNDTNLQVQTLRNNSNLDTAYLRASTDTNIANASNFTSFNNQVLKGNQALLQSSQEFTQAKALSKFNFAQNLATSGFNFGTGLLSAGLSTGLNYLTANALLEKQGEIERQNFDYTTGKASDAFTSAGLPSWLAYTGGKGAGAFPHQTQSVSGSNFFSSSLPGNTSGLAWTGSQSQLALGVGNIPGASS